MPTIIYSDKELKQLYKRAIAKLEKMTPEERFETMIRAGIYTKEGKLTKNYGGCQKKKCTKT